MGIRRRLTVGLFFGALLFLQIAFSIYVDLYDATQFSIRGWRAEQRDGRAVIDTVIPDGPATVLQIGDEPLAVTSPLQDRMPLVSPSRWRVPSGTNYTLRVQRQGEVRDFALQTRKVPLLDILPNLTRHFFNLIFLATGLFVFILKPTDKQAILLALMLGLFTGILSPSVDNLPITLQVYVTIIRSIALLFLPVFLHFFLIFPERSPLLDRFPRLERWLYLPVILVMFAFIPTRMPQSLRFFDSNTWFIGRAWITMPAAIILVSYLVGGLIAMLTNYRAASIASRRKLRIVMVGSGAGFLNLLLLSVFEIFNIRTELPNISDWLSNLQYFTIPLIPLTFAYAIIRHQVIPISLMLRRGFRYLLVSRGSFLLEAGVVTLIITVLLTAVFTYYRPPGLVIGVVSGIVAIVAWNTSRRWHEKYLAPIIDRRFFRQVYDAQHIVSELVESLRRTPNLTELLSEVGTKIQSALQAESVTIFLFDETSDSLQSRFACKYEVDEDRVVVNDQAWQLPMTDRIGKKQLLSGKPIRITKPELLPAPLNELRTLLIMPLSTKNTVLGLIALGPRLGDFPYSRDDGRLLTSVAGPSSFAIENARLINRMIDEARQRREIEIDHQRKTEELAAARKLQLSLLPKRDLSRDGIEIIGRMRTATEVGGDYYDFIDISHGRLCIAVGDATGHGMAAGLLVGMVKMGLASGLHTLNGEISVKRLIEDLNRALRQSIAQRGLGMCLSAALFDTKKLSLELISNGMPYPFHYRHDAQQIEALMIKSPPLGFLKRVEVRPVRLNLQRGDAMIWVSDGFGERMNAQSELWGDEEVLNTLTRICNEAASAEEIADRLFAACDQFADGCANDDDMTIVVARIGLDPEPVPVPALN
jgi:sigma-B regulation protein RsbU (phosphoserine phosphatase)